MSDTDVLMSNMLSRFERMREVRDGYDPSRQKVFNYVNPRRYDMQGTSVRGAARHTKMFDGTAQEAFTDWVHGMLGWGVSESLQWQRAVIKDRRLRAIDRIQLYMDEFTEQMEWEFRASNFYDVEEEWLQDAGSGGTGTMLTEESKDLSRVVHRVPHPGMVWIAEDGEGNVNCYAEKITLTARQVVERYGKDSDRLHPSVRKWASDPAAALWNCTLLQMVCPADDMGIFPRKMVSKPWAVVTMLYALNGGSGVRSDDLLVNTPSERFMRLEGMDYFAPTVWRFRKNSDELYGYSPAMDVLTIIETVQQHAYNLLTMGNLAANPILNVPHEERLAFSRLPGSNYMYGDPNRVVSPVEMNKEYPIAVDREERMHALIRKRYGWHVWNAVLSLQNKKERVQATEVMEVRADQARLIVGQFNNFWRSGVRPVWNNVAAIAGRAGRLPDPPAELDEARGQDVVDIDFIGPLSVVQLYGSKLGGLRQGLGLLGEVAEIVGRHIGPEEAARIYARVNLPDLAEYVCDHSGFPQKLMHTDDETDAIIERRQQAIDQAQQAQQAQQLAQAAGQLGQPVADNSLLAAGSR